MNRYQPDLYNLGNTTRGSGRRKVLDKGGTMFSYFADWVQTVESTLKLFLTRPPP